MGTLFSRSKHQQEKNVEELVRASIEALAVFIILRAEVAGGLKTALGIELSAALIIIVMHLLWVEFGEPFQGITRGITGFFV